MRSNEFMSLPKSIGNLVNLESVYFDFTKGFEKQSIGIYSWRDWKIDQIDQIVLKSNTGFWSIMN
jgi:hypothetical protein